MLLNNPLSYFKRLFIDSLSECANLNNHICKVIYQLFHHLNRLYVISWLITVCLFVLGKVLNTYKGVA